MDTDLRHGRSDPVDSSQTGENPKIFEQQGYATGHAQSVYWHVRIHPATTSAPITHGLFVQDEIYVHQVGRDAAFSGFLLWLRPAASQDIDAISTLSLHYPFSSGPPHGA